MLYSLATNLSDLTQLMRYVHLYYYWQAQQVQAQVQAQQAQRVAQPEVQQLLQAY
jgi:hypothetical protein